MNNTIIKSEKINRESLDLDIVRIDEIKDKPDKFQDVNLDEKHKIEILAQAIITRFFSCFLYCLFAFKFSCFFCDYSLCQYFNFMFFI